MRYLKTIFALCIFEILFFPSTIFANVKKINFSRTVQKIKEGISRGQWLDYVKENGILCIFAVMTVVVFVLLLWFLLKKRHERIRWENLPAEEDLKVAAAERAEEDETIREGDSGSLKLRLDITFDGHTEIVEQRIKRELVFGRGEECDVNVVLHSMAEKRKLTSRRHAVLLNYPDGLYVKNYSKNKSYLNGEEVQGEVSVCDGDILQLGKARVRINIEGETFY